MKITYIRGDTMDIEIPVVNKDGSAKDITAGKVSFTVNANKEPADDTTAVIHIDQTSHTDPLNGLSTVTITNAMGQNLEPKSYWYDVQFIDSSGNIKSLPREQFVVIGDISRNTS